MPRTYRSAVVNADAEAVWAAVRDFNGLSSWAPQMPASVIEDGRPSDAVGCVRRFDGPDGSAIRERLLALSDLDRSYTYNMLEGPFPVTGYKATLRVSPVSDGRAFVEYFATYDCDPAGVDQLEKTFGEHIFGACLGALTTKF
ncbi:MAG: SRPBCC family protein [Streptosporangiales bacterium]|nr:SRPBCC family protein [Streptosporangiales bacterium]